MISDALQKWIVVIIVCLSAVHTQMMPMGYVYGGPMMMPAPMPIPMPVPVPVGVPTEYTTTTTTEAYNGGGDNGMAIAIPMPVPQFLQIAIPGFMPPNCMPNGKNEESRNKNCPPCPPCSCNPCTPSFFSYCSPCHQECRCKNGKENPIPREPNPPNPVLGPAFPMPIPIPGPPPVVIVPFSPQFGHTKIPRSCKEDCDSRPGSNSCCEDSTSTDSCGSDCNRGWRKRKGYHRTRGNYDIFRRTNVMKRNRGDSELVKPVLTYVSRNGDIKMKRRLSNDQANELLGETDPHNMESYRRPRDGDTYHNVRVMAGEDENRRSGLVVMSNPGGKGAGSHRRRQLVLDGNSRQLLRDGKKELFFRTPDNKKISNLSVSFNIGN